MINETCSNCLFIFFYIFLFAYGNNFIEVTNVRLSDGSRGRQDWLLRYVSNFILICRFANNGAKISPHRYKFLKIGEGKRKNEFAEWHVAWLAEWHNYAERKLWKLAQRNKLNWKACARHCRAFFGANLSEQLLYWLTHLDIYLLLVFSVTPFKMDQNKNQNRSIDIVQNLRNEIRYIYKDPRQDSGQRNISYTRYPKKCFTLAETPCWCLPGWAPTWRTETKTNICYRVLLQKREFMLRETH